MLRARAFFISFLSVLLLAVGAAEAAAPTAPGKAPDHDATLARLRADASSEQIRRREDGTVSFFRGRVPTTRFSRAASAPARADDFLAAYGPAFGIGAGQAQRARVETDDLALTHVRYEQRYRGVPVEGRQVIVHLDERGVVAANGAAVPIDDLDVTPRVGALEARATARRALGWRAPSSQLDPALVVYADATGPRLTWRVTTATRDPLGLWRTYVDARDGRIVRAFDTLRTAKSRSVHDNGNDVDCDGPPPDCTLPGAVARAEGDPATGDQDEDDAYTFTGEAYDYFDTKFGRDSYDDAGHVIRSTVNFGVGFANAFWCPDDCAELFYNSAPDGEQLVLGDGDGVSFSELARDRDVVVHELGHGVTSSAVAFEYADQSGALDEAYADLFAVFSAADNANRWKIGETAYTPGTPGDALRNLANPSADGYPAHMDDFLMTGLDSGGVHSNSLIPGHAAYLASETYLLGESVVEQIYYRALTLYLTPTATFLDHLNALINAAIDLHGHGSAQVETIIEAHEDVGIVNAPELTAPLGGGMLQGGASTDVTWRSDGVDGLDFEVSYGKPSGSSLYQQGFEGASLPGGFATSGDAAWTTTASEFWSGARAAVSGDIGDDGRSVLTLTRTLLAPGNLEFLYKISSELLFDSLVFFIDGQVNYVTSGDDGVWYYWSTPVPAGTHTFTWIYEKDESATTGDDRVLIDDLWISNSPSISWTTIGTTAADATSEPWTTPTTTATTYRVRVRSAPLSASQGFGETIGGPFMIDATKPSGVKVTSALAPFQVAVTQTAANVRVPWTGTDAHSGIAAFDLRWRTAGPNGPFDPYELLVDRSTQRAQTIEVTGADLRGATFCFGVRARDAVGNISNYSADGCTAIPIDNLQLGASNGWTTRTNQTGYYLKSYDQSTRRGAFLESAPIKAKRISLIATTCDGCGTVRVYRGTTLLKTISLDASSTKKRQVIPVKTYSSVQSAKTITIEVVSSGKVVRIEGLGVSLG